MVFIPDHDLDRLLAEDVGFGDLTTSVLGIGGQRGIMTFAARHAMVVCATEEAVRMLTRLGLRVELAAPSGTLADPGTPLLQAEGAASALHMGWKVTQTLIEWASGIASAVRDIAVAAGRPGIVVACTRKTVPFTRALSIKAVQSGGGTMHRTGLGDTILLFPEHRAFTRDLDDGALIAHLRARAPERKITVEVTDPCTALRMAGSGVDVLQLEKFTPEQVRKVACALKGHARAPVIAAAGGINAGNARAYADAGASVLVTSAPYYAPPRDVQVRIEPREAGAEVPSVFSPWCTVD